ncbi:Poly(beta-D-mannuronate) C5 epimerase 2 [Aminobacter sp. MSH1]|uniref:DUF5801 repeats-in-toxin domain-containing protein n=1 Tax=Aminobacter sp. MSH1 TaxID=374606 RepID=UPI000D504DB1|nr:DUF5801 repeats-in-toxin domain-containing protein [Aminobacter sp. MSH1]AWC21143.1 Poly(beta-D-mannuronate) C5 epimerase 2 [Aminobacter sp. MSH1]
MATSIEFENVSGALEGASAAGTVQLAQAEGVSPQQPAAQADPVPVDAGSGQPVQAQPSAAAPAQAQAEYVADASNVVHLPASVSIDNIKVDGDNLVLEQADGSVIVIKDAAANVPTFLLGDVEVPRVALIAALEAGGINVAFGADGSISAAGGSASSSGGNFELPAGGIGDGFDLSALLPPTALAFPEYDGRELTLGENADPEFAGFSVRLSEEGLGGGIQDDLGDPDDKSNSASYSGFFGATDPNGDALTYSLGLPTTPGLTSGGQPITWELVGPNLLVGKIDGGEGPDQEIIRLEITNPGTGAFQVTIMGPIDHPVNSVEDVIGFDVPVTVKDLNGGSATANVNLQIEDDSPEISLADAGEPELVVDESNFADDATTSFASSFVTAFGADGAGTVTYALSVVAGESGLLDTATGEQVLLSMNNGVVEGRTAVGNALVFTVKVDANGNVTLDQSRAVKHADQDNHDDSQSLLDNLVKLTATITDGDGDSKSASLDIGANLVFRDDGPSVSENKVVLLDDDALGGNPSGTGDDADSANVSDNLGLDFGADGGSVAWLMTGFPTGFEYKPGADGALEVYQNGTKVLTVTLDSATGAYTVTQNAPIKHATGDNENNQFFTLTYQVTDNDGDTANGTLQINVDDDTPTIVSNGDGAVLTVDESTLGTNATGSFAGNFVTSHGADGPGSVTYALSVVAGNSGLVDTATGQQVVLSMNNGTVEGKTAGGLLVFTVKVDPSGTVTLDQIRAVRHENPDNNDDSRSLTEDLVKLTATVSDADGDSQSATLNIGDNLVFKDDGPSIEPGNASVKVDEDDIWTALSHGTSPDGDTEWFTGAAKASESVAGLVNFGADGAAAGGGFGFTATAVDQMEALGLQSKGSPLSYAVVGNTLVAFVDNVNGPDRPVFTMTLDGDGDFTFRLVDQLDHVAPASGANQNEDLQTDGAPISSIDFGSVIQATDRDGDSVTLAGKVNVSVVDDIPQVHIKATGAAVTHDETAGLQGDDIDDADIAAQFASLDQPAALGYAHQGDVVRYGADLLAPGADEPITMSIALALNGQVNGTDGLASNLQTTSGSQISLYLVDGLIVGRVDNADGSANPNGQIAFAVALDQDGGVSIAQYLPLQHPKPGNGLNDSHDEPVNLGNLVKVVLTATDNDGDAVERSVVIGNKIVFEDDGPKITAPVASAGVVHDETPGNDLDANDTGTISPLNVLNPGSDPHVNNGVGPIGVAQSQGAIVTANVDYGADGAGGLTYALNIGSASTTLLTTEGRAIQLFSEGGIIVGRFDAAGGQIDQGDPAAFAVGIDPVTGVVTLVQYVSLQHPNQGASHDEELSLAANNIRVVLTAKDGDGDTTSATVNVGNVIKFQDDGPKLTVTAPQSVANGLFIDGFTGNNGAWGTGSGTAATGQAAGWKIEASETGGAGTVVLEKVADGYLGADSATNSVMVDLEATPGNIQISQTISGLTTGESYGLSFEIGAANGTAAGSAQLEVIWNGQVVGVYQPTPGPMQTIVINVPAIGGNNDTLEFREVGTSGDNTGTYLANVKLNDIIVIDETATIDPASDEVAATLAIENLFDDVNAGTDLDMSVQYAQGTGSIVNADIAFGADGPAANNSRVFALELANDNGVNSGLETTEGKPIFLYKDASGRVIGVYDADGNGVTSTDKVAFALHVDAGTGVITIAQYVSLHHPDTNSHDEGITLAANTVSVSVTATDGDGDTATGSADISGRVLFEDDGPKVTSVVPTVPALGQELIQNGSFETGHENILGNQDWEIFHSLDGWMSDGNVPFEVQTGGAGGVSTPYGNALVELDSDTVGNPSNGNVGDINATSSTNATIQQTIAGTEAGQTYQLTFAYSPRGGDGAGSSGMQVWFEGKLVYEIPANNNVAPGLQQITINVTATGPNAVLAFKGTGSENQHGALLDNVSLKAVYTTTIDDENVPGGATGIAGGPGDDGAGNVATGKINFDAGSDGLKSIVAEGIDGLKAIHVANGIGTQYDVAQNWAQNGADAGGTLTGTIDVNGTSVTVYTLTIDASGNYTLTMLQPLVHSVTDNPDTSEQETSFEDNRPLDFGFTITDGDGDTATGNIVVNVDDDSPEFVDGGIEDGAVSALNAAVTGDLNLAFGEDGQHATNGLRITGWPELEGITTSLSPDGKTLTATIGGQNGPTLYTLQLNGDGTYTFNQVNSLPGGGNTLPAVSVSGGFGPTATRDYEGFTLKGLDGGLLNGSAGIGIGNNGMNPGEKFAVVYDVEMTSAKLGVNHFGNGTARLDWVAKDQDGNVVASGSSLNISSDGFVTIPPVLDPGLKFFSLEFETVAVEGNSPKFKLISVGGETHADALIDKLNFEVTGKDGDGDTVSDAFDIKLGGSKPQAGNVWAAVDEDGLPGANNAPGSVGDIDANVGEVDPGDPSEAIFLGKLEGSGGDGALVFSFADLDTKYGTVGQEQVIYSWDDTSKTLTATGPRGELFTIQITDTATGAYKLTLLDNVLHAAGGDEANAFTALDYTVGDSDANTSTTDTDTGTLTIKFNDDVPTAAADVRAMVEGAASVAGSAVLGQAGGDVADPLGADGASIAGPVTGVAAGNQTASGNIANANVGGAGVAGAYGTLVMGADGVYTYTPDYTKAAFATLAPGQFLQDVFTYEVTDDDGDVSVTTLTIQVNADAHVPVITGDTGTVYEDGLVGGTQASTARETDATGTFTVTANGEAFTLTVGGATGTTVTSAVLEAAAAANNFSGIAPVNTGEGSLTITGYNAATGVVSYSYALTAPQTHTGQGAGAPVTDTIPISVTDATGDTVTGEINMSIVDDVPMVTIGGDDNGSPTSSTVDEGTSVSGNWTMQPGADGVVPDKLTISYDDGTSHTVQVSYGQSIDTAYGKLTLQAPVNGVGTWTFLANQVTGSKDVTFTIKAVDGDGDTDSDAHTISVIDVNKPLVINPDGLSGVVEEEHGLSGGIDDFAALVPGLDLDEPGNLGNTTNVAGGNFSSLITGGDEGTLTFAFQEFANNPAVQTVSNGALKSGGAPVLFAIDGNGDLVGYVNKGGLAGYEAVTDTKIFTITLNPTSGEYTFTLNGPVDHPVHAPSTEDAITINLNGYVTVTDSGGPAGDTKVPLNASIAVIDDVPVAQNDTGALNIVIDQLGVQNIVASWTTSVLTNGGEPTQIDRDGDVAIDEIRWGGTGSNATDSGYGFVDAPQANLNNLVTNNTFSLGTFTHFNNPIDGSTLSTTKLSVSFTAIVNGQPVNVGPIVVSFTHDETPNDGNDNPNDGVDSRDVIKITSTTSTVIIAGQNYTLDVLGLVKGSGSPVTEIFTNEGASNPFELMVRFVSSNSSALTTNGAVLANDDAGADGGLTVVGLQGTNSDTDPAGGGFVVNGTYGKLVMQAGGTYVYSLTADGNDVPPGYVEKFNYTVRDGDGDTSTANLDITLSKTVTDVNLAPDLQPNSPAEIVYDASGAAVKLLAAGTVTDADNPTNFAGGKITAQITSGVVAGDGLTLFVGGPVSESAGNVMIGGTAVGTITGYGTANVTITLNSSATDPLAETILQNLSFSSSSANPTAADRTVKITFDDGGNTGIGGAKQDSVDVTVNVVPPNAAPVLALNDFGPGAATDDFSSGYTSDSGWKGSWSETNDGGLASEGDIRIVADKGDNRLWLTDGDDSGSGGTDYIARSVDLTGAQSATLTFDYRRVSLDNSSDTVQVQISTNGGSFQTIHTFAPGTDADYKSITFDISSYMSANTTIRLVADNDLEEDGEGVYFDNIRVDYQGFLSSTNNSTEYTENGAPISIAAAGPTIADGDDSYMESARIVLTNAKAGDVMGWSGMPSGIAAAVDTSVAGQITVTLSGHASLSAYQAAIKAVTFHSTSENPSTEPREIEVTVNDGQADSNVATTTISVTAVADVANAVNDVVLTNITDYSAIHIPNAALLYNDAPGNNPLSVSSVQSPVGGTIVNGAVFDPTNPVAIGFSANFSANGSDLGGFVYSDQVFGGTGNDASGVRASTGNGNAGALHIDLGGGTNDNRTNMNGAFSRTFNLVQAATIVLTFDYRLQLSGQTDNNDDARVLARIDGTALGVGGIIHELEGDNGSTAGDTGWQTFTATINLSAGSHTLDLGGLMTSKNNANEFADIDFDNVVISGTASPFASGSFTYTATDGATPDTASVTVTGVSGSTITGTNSGEILIGGDGDDILVALGGNDVLIGGKGLNTLTGGDGADLFVIEHLDAPDLITDYDASEGDKIDLSALLDSNFGPNSNVAEYVRVVGSGSNADLQVDVDGGGNNFVTVATLQNYDPASSSIRVLFDGEEHTPPVVP